MDQRRSRMRRARRGKRLEFTSRDIEIFRLLCRYRYLSSTYIHAFVGGASETRFKERLGDLFHEGYVDRPEKQWELTNCRHRPAIYEIGQGGLNVLRDGVTGDTEPRTWLGLQAHRQFLHSLMICKVLASIELEARAKPHLRFVPWPEIVAKAPDAARNCAGPLRFTIVAPHPVTVIPDALFGIEYRFGEKKSYRFFALETDRGTMPIVRSAKHQTSYLGKLAGYREIIACNAHKAHLGIPNLLVLTVTTSEERVRTILRWLEEQSEGNAIFLFKAASLAHLTTPAHRLLSDLWPRAGLSALRIDE